MKSQNSAGAVYIAYGEPAVVQARLSILSLRRAMPSLPVAVIGDHEARRLGELPLVHVGYDREIDEGGRYQKLNLFWTSPWDYTAYLDADTRIHENIAPGLKALDDGWDVVMTYSECQGQRMLWHVSDPERQETLFAWPMEPLQMQGGVFFFRKSTAVETLFEAWRSEWTKYQDQDQGALLRALAVAPVKLWLLGRPWNGGQVINHLYGRAKRNR